MYLVTDDARARMVRQRPITDAMAWHRAMEAIMVTNLRTAFVLWRIPMTWWAR